MAKPKYQNMSYDDIRPISQFSNVNPGNTNVLWGVKNNPYGENNLNPDGTTWNWLCNAIDIYWGKPTLNVTGDVTSVQTPIIATTTDLLKFIETTAQAVNNKVNKVEIPKNSGESVNLPENGYVFTWNGEATEYRDMYWDGESESKMIVFVDRKYPLESGNSKLGKIWKAIVCDYDPDSGTISYYDTYTDPNIPDNVLALFNEKEATTTRSGLMSSSDKKKLDNIIVDINEYKTADAVLPIGGGYIYYDSSLSYGKYINLERISLAFDDEKGNIEGSRGSDNEPFYIFRNNVGQDDETFYVWDCNGRYHGRWNEYDGYQGPDSDDAYWTEAYRRDENPIDVISCIKEVLCENLVSEYKDGLMSSSDKEKLDNLNVIDIKDYMTENSKLPTGGVYIYYGLPTEFKICNEDGSDYLVVFGVMRESVNDDYEVGQIKSVVLYDYNDENDYMTYRETQFAPNIDTDVLQLFNEEVATSDKKGLMSADDKNKLNDLPTVFQYSQYCKPNSKIPFNTDFSNYILPCNVEMRRWRNNEYYYLCFANNELGDIDDTDNTNWRLRKNYYLFMLQDASGQDTDNYTYVGEYPNTIVLSDQTALDAKVAEAFGYSNNSSNS